MVDNIHVEVNLNRKRFFFNDSVLKSSHNTNVKLINTMKLGQTKEDKKNTIRKYKINLPKK